MFLDRRKFLIMTGGVAASLHLSASASQSQTTAESKFKALAFDAFTTFDPRSIFTLAEELFPGKGTDLSNLWRTRQSEYLWLRTLSRRYVDFDVVTEEALVFAAKMLKLYLTPDKRKGLLEAYLRIKDYPDVLPALNSLKKSGLRLAFLSNLTPKILNASIRNSNFEGVFEHIISTGALKTYKPDPRAYQMGIDTFKLKKKEIVFVASGGWDAAGAKSFGYTTFWVNRLDLPVEELGVLPDATGKDLSDLVRFMTTPNSSDRQTSAQQVIKREAKQFPS